MKKTRTTSPSRNAFSEGLKKKVYRITKASNAVVKMSTKTSSKVFGTLSVFSEISLVTGSNQNAQNERANSPRPAKVLSLFLSPKYMETNEKNIDRNTRKFLIDFMWLYLTIALSPNNAIPILTRVWPWTKKPVMNISAHNNNIYCQPSPRD